VCFAGVGPGEVLTGDRKLVGLSQRRTRHGIRIQCQAHRLPLLTRMPDLFASPIPDADLVEAAVLADVTDRSPDDSSVAGALVAAMEHRITAM
jgi:lipoate-protein ligase A